MACCSQMKAAYEVPAESKFFAVTAIDWQPSAISTEERS